jgi:RND family efflux transporter MFP subunit
MKTFPQFLHNFMTFPLHTKFILLSVLSRISVKTKGFPMSVQSNLANVFSKIKLPSFLSKLPRKVLWGIVAVLVLAIAGGVTYYQLMVLPSQVTATAAPAMQTSVVRRGNITLSASGTGTLVAANQVQLGFSSSGKLIKLNVKVGDQVQAGQLLAEIDNSTQQTQLLQAKRAVANLTSATAIATAQQAIATAENTVYSTKNQLIYLISPRVFYDEQQIAAAQTALNLAKTEAGSSPTSDQQKIIDAATAKLKSAQAALSGDMIWYNQNYVKNTFTVIQMNAATHKATKVIQAPTDADIASARAAFAGAQASVQEAQWYLSALSGGTVPDTATGTNLSTFEQAKLTLQTAQDTLGGTQLLAPFAGIVTTVSAQLGDSVGSTAIITVVDMSKLYVQTYIDQADYAMFVIGNSANVTFDALPNLTLTGKIVSVDPALVTSGGTSAVSGMVQLDPTSTHLLLGMSAAVQVVAGDAQNAVLAPVAALHETTPGQYSVFVVQNGKLTLTSVTIGLQDLVNVEIKSGLQPGDVVSTGIVGTK